MTQVYCLIILEAKSLRSRCQALHLRAMREGSLSSPSSWLIDGFLFPESSHYLPYVPICVQISCPCVFVCFFSHLKMFMAKEMGSGTSMRGKYTGIKLKKVKAFPICLPTSRIVFLFYLWHIDIQKLVL